MKTFTKALAKGAVATAVAGAMVVSAATPAMARDRDRDRGGISAGDVVAGALVIGGIAAIAATAGNDRGYGDYNYDRAGYDRGNRYDRGNGYNRAGNPQAAIAQCVATAEQAAGRYSYGRAKVTDIRDVDRNDRGYTVKGRIAVYAQGRNWRGGDPRYGNGWGGDYRGWNDGMRGYDSGSFKCKVEYGRVVDLDFSGVRGL